MTTLLKRSYKRCKDTPQLCYSSNGSDRCVEYIRVGVDYDLSPINILKWKRLEERRKRLRKERSEAMARLIRLDKEIESIKEDQERMVQKELKNIQDLEVEEATTIESNVSLDAFDGIELPAGWNK